MVQDVIRIARRVGSPGPTGGPNKPHDKNTSNLDLLCMVLYFVVFLLVCCRCGCVVVSHNYNDNTQARQQNKIPYAQSLVYKRFLRGVAARLRAELLGVCSPSTIKLAS